MGKPVLKNNIRYLFNMQIGSLTSVIPDYRYPFLIRGSLLITASSVIAIIETFLAIYYDLHHVPYTQAVYAAIIVLSMTSVLFAIPYFKRDLLVWHEWAVFSVYVILFQVGFCIWIYRLEGMRFLAVINALTTITILLSYTNIVQSLLISVLVLFSYYSVSWYSIKIAGQPGSLAREAFLSFCLFPAFILISLAAYHMNQKRNELQRIKSQLEKLNDKLSCINIKLQKENILTEIEMDLAGEIQGALFPGKVPDVKDWDIAFISRPYSTVSGDFYDFYCRDNSLKGVSLFDVSGHGVAPALVTILAKPVIFTHFNRGYSLQLGAVIDGANRELHLQLEEVNLYITGILLRMNGHSVEYVNAGHPDLLHYDTRAGEVRIVKDNSTGFKGHPIGISLSDKSYESFEFNVSSGDFLIFYSDGLIESRNYLGEQFGINRISDAVKLSASGNAESLLETILGSLYSFTGNNKAADDITLIVAGKI